VRWLPAGLLTVVAFACYLYAGALTVPQTWKHDFLGFYTASYFARHGQLDRLYDPAALAQFQETIAPENSYVIPFSRPRFYAQVLSPLSLLPYRTAFAAWVSCQAALLLGCWAWFAARFGPDALIMAAFFFPAGIGIAHGQDAVVLLVLAIASYAAFEGKNQALAGMLIGCMLFKFHLILLLPVAMLVQRRWKMLQGFALAAASLAAVELWIGGGSGIADYAHFLMRRDIPGLNPGEQMMVNIHSLLINLGMDTAGGRLTLSLIAIVLVMAGMNTAEWWRATASAGLGSAVLLPHTYQYDLTWTLLPLLCIAFLSTDKPVRVSILPLLTPFPYLLNLAGMPWSGATSLCLLLVLGANAWVVRGQQVALTFQRRAA
jgi:hypothetical protein